MYQRRLTRGGRAIAYGCVEPLLRIHVLEEMATAGACLLHGLVVVEVHFLLVQRLHETFGLGVVVRVAAPPHADPDTVRSQSIGLGAPHLVLLDPNDGLLPMSLRGQPAPCAAPRGSGP